MTDATKVDETSAVPVPAFVAGRELIHARMIAVMRELGAIGKDKQNTQQGFKYRGIDQVYNAINPLLAKHGVYMTAKVLNKERTERTNKNGTVLAFTCLHMRYRFVAEDGSAAETEAEGEGMDSGDKSSNKSMAVAHKYALLQAFCVPTEDMPDPDAEVHEIRSASITTAQRDELLALIKAGGVNVDEFCGHFKIEAVPDLPSGQYDTAISMLKRRAAHAAKAGKQEGKQ